MATFAIKQPRRIDPSLIEIGDDIAVEHKANRGLVVTQRGIVAKRIDHGSNRYLMTEEGATILAWEPGKNTGVKITLYGREEKPQETLFDNMDELRARIAG